MSGLSGLKPGVHWDTCLVCGKDIRLISGSILRYHGPANKRCPGSHSAGRYVTNQRRERTERWLGQ